MFKNISTVKLLGLLALLVLVYLGITFFGKEERSKSFREELVEIDTAAVSKIEVYGEDTLSLFKEDNNWKVTLSQGATADAVKNKVKNLLSTLESIEPSRIATRNLDNWKDYGVDSTGTRVMVYEGDDKTLDLVVGRFGMQQGSAPQPQYGMRGSQQFYTYVRLSEEDEVYAADDFMGMSLSTDVNSYRNNRILEVVTDSVSAVQFNYPADSSFMIEKSIDNDWIINNQQADSSSVASYMSDISRVNGSDFADDVTLNQLGAPQMTMTLKVKGEEDVVVEAYKYGQYNWIIHSSKNPDALFADQEGDLTDEIFVSQDQLLNPGEE